MTINLSTVLDQSSGQHLVEEYLDKEFLARRDWDTPLVNVKYAQSRPLEMHAGQYTKYTRKNRTRRPETMASPGGAGSDPASGATLTVDKVLVPIEYIHEYMEIATVAQQTSWIDLEMWSKEEMPYALKRRMNELVQNAFLVGRMTPGLWSSTSTVETTDFDASAEATVTLYGISFTFTAAPKYYANGKSDFALLDENDTISWADVRKIVTKLRMAGARPISIGGMSGIMCVLSHAQCNDLLADNDGGKLDAVLKSGNFGKGVDGIVGNYMFSYAGAHFVVDDNPFTENAGSEGVRANYGEIHSALFFGQEAFGYLPMGGQSGMKPKFKVQDITKTGYSKSIGYLIPWQVAIINADWCAVLKSVVSESKPNNYDESAPTTQLEGFGV